MTAPKDKQTRAEIVAQLLDAIDKAEATLAALESADISKLREAYDTAVSEVCGLISDLSDNFPDPYDVGEF